MKVPLELEQNFYKFLKRVRKEENVYLDQLAEGLMTVSQLARIEKGQRPIPKNMRDRLLGRLGVASDLYENLLNIEDYAAWEHQRNILSAIEKQETQKAHELIIAYEKEAPIHDKIKQQFCLIMKAEVLKQQGTDQQEIADCYEAAVKYTIPDVENMCLKKKLLSIQEINMVLEYEWYHKDEDFVKKCRDLMIFVEKSVYDDLSKVKVYPKIVYYYLQEIFSGQRKQIPEVLGENLRICNVAIEMLRDTGRAFFLIELLEMKIKILECMEQNSEEEKELQPEYHASVELADLLKKLSVEYDVPAYMQDCTYLYQQRWVFYIGDVLRIRREMYGITQKELCKGICSVRTLRRMEKRETNMQQEALGALLRKLGLSKEFQRARLVTNDREVLRLKKEIFNSRNNRDFARCRELLSQLQEKISLDIPGNRQYVIELEASLDWREGKISKEKFVVMEEEALQCTLKEKRLFSVDEIYLTELEILCIRKIMQGLAGSEKRKYIDFLLRFFELYEKKYILSDCIVMYEYVIMFVASELGSIGQHQSAIELDKKVLKEDLMCKRVWVISIILYDILWNEKEQMMENGQLLSKEKMAENLEHCILLSHFCRQPFYEKFYNDKLDQS
ncbi:MAG: helix-turn-helix domain-containing protein [Lachnospiraceae bacterium]|nr:helix-turn-helix domain-containing protein [Lachnospiraceae bacterium]